MLILIHSLCSAVFDKQHEPLSVDQQEERAMAKRKMLGNIKFIGKPNNQLPQ